MPQTLEQPPEELQIFAAGLHRIANTPHFPCQMAGA
jgi:hypothetical protein